MDKKQVFSISIIIPTLNSEELLPKCLDSLGGQDYPADKLQVIIADGDSTDKTLAIIEDFKRIAKSGVS